MATQARLHWFWRESIALFVGMIFNAVWFPVVLFGFGPLLQQMMKIHRPLLPDEIRLFLGVSLLFAMPSSVAAIAMHDLLMRCWAGQALDGELHCRRCNHIFAA